MQIIDLTEAELASVAGGLTTDPKRPPFTVPHGEALGHSGPLVVGANYVRDDGMDVTIVAKNSNGTYQVRDNNTGTTMTYTSTGG